MCLVGVCFEVLLCMPSMCVCVHIYVWILKQKILHLMMMMMQACMHRQLESIDDIDGEEEDGIRSVHSCARRKGWPNNGGAWI